MSPPLTHLFQRRAQPASGAAAAFTRSPSGVPVVPDLLLTLRAPETPPAALYTPLVHYGSSSSEASAPPSPLPPVLPARIPRHLLTEDLVTEDSAKSTDSASSGISDFDPAAVFAPFSLTRLAKYSDSSDDDYRPLSVPLPATLKMCRAALMRKLIFAPEPLLLRWRMAVFPLSSAHSPLSLLVIFTVITWLLMAILCMLIHSRYSNPMPCYRSSYKSLQILN